MSRALTILAALAIANCSYAQGVNITSWKFNTTGNTYNGIVTDVAAVYYTSSNVYIKSSGIPYYYIDGLTVNDGSDMHWTFNIPRNPTENTGSKTPVGQGQVGVYLDGSVMFHPGDAQSYNGAGQWWRIAYFFEHPDFDPSNGHSTPTHTYHHHVYNKQLSSTTDSSKHSKLVGYAWDGYPVYGGFGFTDPMDSTSHITRMRTSYQTRSITARTTLPGGTAAAGPAIGGMYPLGCFIEDYEYVSGSGTLDQYNGRFCRTPEYPAGTYAYFKTLDASLNPEYPYHIGPYFYGVVQPGNVGPTGGQFTVPGGATLYTPPVTGVPEEGVAALQIVLYPNPVTDKLYIEVNPKTDYAITVTDVAGNAVQASFSGNTLNMQQLAGGIYIVTLTEKATGLKQISRIVKQ